MKFQQSQLAADITDRLSDFWLLWELNKVTFGVTDLTGNRNFWSIFSLIRQNCQSKMSKTQNWQAQKHYLYKNICYNCNTEDVKTCESHGWDLKNWPKMVVTTISLWGEFHISKILQSTFLYYQIKLENTVCAFCNYHTNRECVVLNVFLTSKGS